MYFLHCPPYNKTTQCSQHNSEVIPRNILLKYYLQNMLQSFYSSILTISCKGEFSFSIVQPTYFEHIADDYMLEKMILNLKCS